MSALSGQRVVVVGGASGIGLAVARGAKARGAQVTVMDLDAERLASLASEDMTRTTLDVRDEASVVRAFAPIERIDHVYVAAGSTRLGALLASELEPQLDPLTTRLRGSVHVIRAAAARVRPAGSFVLTGGVSTDRPVAGAWVSSVGTAATEQLARTMAMELAPVRFNAVAPGWTDTPMWDAVLGANKAAVFQEVAKKQLTGRLSRAEEVADAVLFLMGNEAITGEVVHVDGGGRLV